MGECARERPVVVERHWASEESVAIVSPLMTLDKTDLTERTGKLSRSKLELVLSGIDVVLGRLRSHPTSSATGLEQPDADEAC